MMASGVTGPLNLGFLSAPLRGSVAEEVGEAVPLGAVGGRGEAPPVEQPGIGGALNSLLDLGLAAVNSGLLPAGVGDFIRKFRGSPLASFSEAIAADARPPAFPLPLPDWVSEASRSDLADKKKERATKFAVVAAKTSPAYRAALERLLAIGKLDDQDETGRTALDYLYAAANTNLAKEATEHGVTNAMLVSSLVRRLDDPNDISQRTDSDCVWANVTRDLAAASPVDYVKFNLGLYARGAAKLPGASAEVRLADGELKIGDRLASGGQPLGTITDLFRDRIAYALGSDQDRRLAAGYLGMLGHGVPVVLGNADGSGHLVTVDAIKGDSLEYFDPADPDSKHLLDLDRFLSDATAVLLPSGLKIPLSEIGRGDSRPVMGGRHGRRAVRG